MNDKNEQSHYIISGRYLLPTWRQADRIDNGAIAVYQDRVTAIGTREQLRAKFPEAKELHEPAGLIMPGLINTIPMPQ